MNKTSLTIGLGIAAFVAAGSVYEATVSFTKLSAVDSQMEQTYRTPAKINVAFARKLNSVNGIDSAGVELLCKKSDSLSGASKLFSMTFDNLMLLPDDMAGSLPMRNAEMSLQLSELAKNKACSEVNLTMKRDLADTTGNFMAYSRMQSRIASELPTTAAGYPKIFDLQQVKKVQPKPMGKPQQKPVRVSLF